MKEPIRDKKFNIYVTAIWCLPCVKKLISESEMIRKDTSALNILLIDRIGYTKAKLDKLKINFFDSTNIYLLPFKYYSKSFIQINSSDKGLKSFLKELQTQFPTSTISKEFWFGDVLTISEDNIISDRKIILEKD